MPETVASDKYTEKIPRFTLPSEFSNEPKAEVKPEAPPATPLTPTRTAEPLPQVKEEAKPVEVSATAPEAEISETETTGKDQAKPPSRAGAERRIFRAIRKANEATSRAEALTRELAELRTRATPAPAPSGAPRMEDFTDIGEFQKAVEKYAREDAVKEYETKQRQGVQQQATAKMLSNWAEKVARADEKYDDFEEVVGDLKPTTPWAVALMRSDNGEEVAYYLGSHQKEAQKIFALDPVAQFLEIGKLSSTLSATPAKLQTPSKAPAPITPVTGAASTGEPDLGTPMPFEQYRKMGNKMFRGR